MTKETMCAICDEKLSGKKLSNHIRKIHNMSSEEYTVAFVYNNVRPT
jgi:hypothetical protein